MKNYIMCNVEAVLNPHGFGRVIRGVLWDVDEICPCEYFATTTFEDISLVPSILVKCLAVRARDIEGQLLRKGRVLGLGGWPLGCGEFKAFRKGSATTRAAMLFAMGIIPAAPRR